MASSKAHEYILHYWPGIPGRGEYIRLAFESVSQKYTESRNPMSVIKSNKSIKAPSHFAPPILEIKTGTSDSYYISQTPAILAYLAPILHLDGVNTDDQDAGIPAEIRRAQVNQVTLTILDLSNETHDVHHPIAAGAYYEDQKQEAKRRADDFRATRVPKFLGIFQSTIETNPESNGWLTGSSYTVADLTLFQVIEGLTFAFPRLMKALKTSGKYNLVFALRDKVASIDAIQGYLQSDRRIPFGNGVFRHYPELDGEA